MRLVVGALQLSCAPEPPKKRLERIAAALSEAAQRGVRVAVLPEVAVTGYALGFDNLRLAEPVPGPMVSALAGLARHHDLVVVAGLVERVNATYYDTLVVVDPRGYRGSYRKVHVSAVENAYWARGGYARPIDTIVGRIGVGVCADMAYRTPWQWYFKDEVDLIAVGSAWPDLRDLRPMNLGLRTGILHREWTRTLPEKISNALGVPFIYANWCGPLDLQLPILGLRIHGRFAGSSRVVHGETLSEADDSGTEGWVIAEVEVGKRVPNLTVWDGPWLPRATLWQRVQMYSSDNGLAYLSRLLYYLWSRRRAGLAS